MAGSSEIVMALLCGNSRAKQLISPIHPHLIQWIFRQPKWGNKEVVSFCRAIAPDVVKEIQRTRNDAYARELLDKLTRMVNKSRRLPEEMIAELVIRLIGISESANRSNERRANNRFSRSRNYA
jgi:hypothetical protein